MIVNGYLRHRWGMGREDLHFRLRIPEALKTKIEEAAALSRRSMTSEIIHRLEASLGPVERTYEIGPARERFKLAVEEMKAAIHELEIAELMG